MPDPFRHPDWQLFVRAMLAAPSDSYPRALAADWLQDRGVPAEKAAETTEPPTFSQFLPVTYFGSGIGSGRGRGIGSGRGSGSGIGSGSGSGSGIGIGIGRGRGSGSGRGSGIGSGRGSGRNTVVEIGKAYLIETVDWFAWVGRVKRQAGPWEYEMESCSKIRETNNGDNWDALAAGDKAARRACEYRHYTTPVILGLGAVAKIEWVGETPQEESSHA